MRLRLRAAPSTANATDEGSGGSSKMRRQRQRQRVTTATATATAAEDGSGVEGKLLENPPFPIWVNPTTSNFEHDHVKMQSTNQQVSAIRSCIPCVHVCRRSCLQGILHSFVNGSAKCPLCDRQFQEKHIVNLNEPQILRDNVSHLQPTNLLLQKLEEYYRDLLAYVQGEVLHFSMTCQLDERKAFSPGYVMKEWSRTYPDRVKKINEEVATVNTKLMEIKDQMKKMMVGEENMPTTDDLTEFLDLNWPICARHQCAHFTNLLRPEWLPSAPHNQSQE